MLLLLAAVAITVVVVVVELLFWFQFFPLHFIIQFPQINVSFDVWNSELIFIVCLQFVNCLCTFLIDPKRISSKRCIYFENISMSHISKIADLQPKIRQATNCQERRNEVPFFFWLFCQFSCLVWRLERAIKPMTKIDDDNSVIQHRNKTSKHSELRNKK